MSFCPSKRPIVDALSDIKAIATMDHGINRPRIKCVKERSIVEFLEIGLWNNCEDLYDIVYTSQVYPKGTRPVF